MQVPPSIVGPPYASLRAFTAASSHSLSSQRMRPRTPLRWTVSMRLWVRCPRCAGHRALDFVRLCSVVDVETMIGSQFPFSWESSVVHVEMGAVCNPLLRSHVTAWRPRTLVCSSFQWFKTGVLTAASGTLGFWRVSGAQDSCAHSQQRARRSLTMAALPLVTAHLWCPDTNG